jgi:hypothetical protein
MENNPAYESVATTTSLDDDDSSESNEDGELKDNVSELGNRDSGFGFRLKRMAQVSGQGMVKSNGGADLPIKQEGSLQQMESSVGNEDDDDGNLEEYTD